MSTRYSKYRIPVLIPVYNQLEYTAQAIESLCKNTDQEVFKCIVIDNGSTDGTPSYLKDLSNKLPKDEFEYIRSETNLGFAGGVNKGFESISSEQWDFVVVANNDLLFTPNWLNQMLECMSGCKVPRVGIVGPMSNYAGGIQGMQANYTLDNLDAFAVAHHKQHTNRYQEIGTVVGLLMLVRRQFIDQVGVFDERFKIGCWEENDLELRGALKGWRYVVDQSTFVHHFGSKTLAVAVPDGDQGKNFRVNKKIFWDKWHSVDGPWEKLAYDRYVLRGQDPEKFRLPSGILHKWVVGACKVKDGAQWMEKVLTRVSEFADEIVVLVDQASTDSTEEICRKFPKVVLMEKEVPREYNEAYSRNKLLKMAFDRHGDWIFSFDADELIERQAITCREELTNPDNPATMLWTQPVVQLWNSDSTQRIDGLWGPFRQGRLFRVVEGQALDNVAIMHPGSTPPIPVDRQQPSFIRIAHYGNVEPELRKTKYQWYSATDTTKNLDMVLGGHKEFYWQNYYGQPDPQEKSLFISSKQRWSVLDKGATLFRPPFGTFNFKDVYRHLVDERNLSLVPFDENQSLSLCLVTQNNVGVMASLIRDARIFIHQLVVVDKGSTDGTDNIAESSGAKVLRVPSTTSSEECRKLAGHHSRGTWILNLDLNEEFPREASSRLPEWICNKEVDGYVFPVVHWFPNAANKLDWTYKDSCRLFRNVFPGIDVTSQSEDASVQMSKTGFRTMKVPFQIQSKVVQASTKPVEALKVEAPLVLVPGENTVTLCMMVKNEVKNLKATLDSAKPLCQEIVIVDTGSTDGTRELALQYTDKVYDFQWCDNYSAPRNFALSKATQKWILFLDGDELVPPDTLRHYHQLIQNPDLTAVLTPVKNIHIPTQESPTNFHYSETYRLFRNDPKLRFSGVVHEDIGPSIEKLAKTKKVGVIRATQFITNLGFLVKAESLQAKHEYYAELILKEIRQNPTYFKPYYEYAVYLLDQGDLDGAERYYKKAISLNPTFHMAQNDMAVIKIKQAVDKDLLLEAAGYLDLAAIESAKKASPHQQQVIGSNIQIIRQMLKYLNIKLDTSPRIPQAKAVTPPGQKTL